VYDACSFCSYLDRLSRLEERFVGVRHVVQRDPVELALVDVRYSVVLATLRRADGRLQVVFKSVGRETAGRQEDFSEDEKRTNSRRKRARARARA